MAALPWRTHLWPLALALVLSGTVAGGAASPAAAVDWTRPFRISSPVSLDLLPAQVATSAGGAAGIGYAAEDVDDTALSQALVSSGSAGGGFGPSVPIPGAQQALALAYRDRDLWLLAGASEAGQSCCSSVLAVGPSRGGSLGPRRTLLSGLAGATAARLLPIPGRLLAVIATERGIWASQSGPGGGGFPAPHRLSGARELPQSMDAVALAGGRTAIAWTARSDAVTAPGPRTLYLARGSLRRPPGSGRVLLTVARGHEIDELALADRGARGTVAWVESWYDRTGRYHSQVRVSDLGARLRPRSVSSSRELAAGIGFAGLDDGTQILGWKGCTSAGSCSVRAMLRPPRRGFGPVREPGPVDAAQTPAVTLTARREAEVGWVSYGHVFAAAGSGTRLSPPHAVAATSFATDLALAGAPNDQALAVWTQGTLAQSLIGAGSRGS